MLISTKQAAELTGLSEYELRYGFKRGLYPALEVGRGSRRKSLRWDPDILRQTLVQGIGKFISRHTGLCVKNGNIPEGMHAGIRPARADHLHRFLQKLRQAPVEDLLYTDPV